MMVLRTDEDTGGSLFQILSRQCRKELEQIRHPRQHTHPIAEGLPYLTFRETEEIETGSSNTLFLAR
jgi:hypothetical protein